jgi:uncharacterized membrane protein
MNNFEFLKKFKYLIVIFITNLIETIVIVNTLSYNHCIVIRKNFRLGIDM